MAESFLNLLEREWIRRRTYRTREEARQDVFDYGEMFYNPNRKHVTNGMQSPIDFDLPTNHISWMFEFGQTEFIDKSVDDADELSGST